MILMKKTHIAISKLGLPVYLQKFDKEKGRKKIFIDILANRIENKEKIIFYQMTWRMKIKF